MIENVTKWDISFYTLLLVIIGIHGIIFLGPVQSDGANEMAIGEAILRHGRIELYGSPDTHFPPIIPFMILPFLALIGINSLAIHVAQFFYYIVVIFTGYKCGEVYSTQAGRVMALLIASDPIILGSMMGATSEVILELFILLAIYFYILSQRREEMFIASSFFASMAYLSKATSLTIAIAAVIAVFVLLRRYRPSLVKWRILLPAGVSFILPIILWSVRNYLALGVWDTNSYTSCATLEFLSTPSVWYLLVIYIIILGLWSIIPMVPFLVQTALKGKERFMDTIEAMKRNELTSLFGAFLILGSFGGAALMAYEPSLYENPYFSVQHIRYVSVGIPIVFLALMASLPQKGKLMAPAIAMVVIMATMFMPVIQGEMVFVDEYRDIRDYLEQYGVREVWADATGDIKYNIPDIEVHHFTSLKEVPDNSTVITTRIVDDPPARKFWRFAVTIHLIRPPQVHNVSFTLIKGQVHNTLYGQWEELNISDLKGYIVLVSERNFTSVESAEIWRFTEKNEIIISDLDMDECYVAVIGVDNHDNHVYQVHPRLFATAAPFWASDDSM